MADKLISEIFNGDMDHRVILESLQSYQAIQVGDSTVALFEFVPKFLSYLRERLTPVFNSPNVYFSPRQIQEKKKHVERKKNSQQPKKSARISLQYSSSSPSKEYSVEVETNGIEGISPIRQAAKWTSPFQQKNKSANAMTNSESHYSRDMFELSSHDDFPSISLSAMPNSKKNPRRITATTVAVNLDTVQNTPKVCDFSGSTFLEESSFETQNADTSFNQLFTDDKRFINSSLNMAKHELSEDTVFHSKSSIEATPTKQMEVWNEEDVPNRHTLNVFIDIYSCICLQKLIPNFTLELYFLFMTLTYSSKESKKMQYHFPFVNLQSCAYFGAKCLERMSNFIVLLDIKTLQMLVDNPRLRSFVDAKFLNSIENEIKKDLADEIHHSVIVKSPMTGIPFQVESDNRKTFLTDKHFYSFSKKRDAFYALVRKWQALHMDPDWNMKRFMSEKVPELMKSCDGINTDYQFARLFVGQLLEMCRNSVGSKSDEPNISDSVLLELKKSNPSKFQNLQDRLTRPSASHDLCPKPSFSRVEEFFKEFILLADCYCFNIFLIHTLIAFLMDINSQTFGLDTQTNHKHNKSDIAESLWQDIKTAISELRLLAKFLGFVHFLTYNLVSSNNGDAMLTSRHLVTENLGMLGILETAYREHRLLITIPWTVDFFSMADSNAFEMEIYKKPLRFLASLVVEHTRKFQCFSLWNMTLNQHIGWLLDQPCVHKLNIYELVTSKYDFQNLQSKEVIGIDDVVEIDKTFMYDLCPYLNDIRKPLLDFAKGANSQPAQGSFRKITAVSTTDIFSTNIDNQKLQLMDSFMKHLPNHVQDCIKFITERHVTNIKQHCSTNIINMICQDVMEKVKADFHLNEEKDITMEDMKGRNLSKYTKRVEEGQKELGKTCHLYLRTYLDNRIVPSVENLLPESVHLKIIEVSIKLIKHNIRIKIQEWLPANRDMYVNGVEVMYNRYIKNIIKTTCGRNDKSFN